MKSLWFSSRRRFDSSSQSILCASKVHTPASPRRTKRPFCRCTIRRASATCSSTAERPILALGIGTLLRLRRLHGLRKSPGSCASPAGCAAQGLFQGGGLRIKRCGHGDCRGTANQDEHYSGQNEQLPHHTPRVKGQEQSPTMVRSPIRAKLVQKRHTTHEKAAGRLASQLSRATQ